MPMTSAKLCGLAIAQFLHLPLTTERKGIINELAAYDTNIVVLAAIESGFRQQVKSSAGAIGVMQLMPIAVKEAEVQCGISPGEISAASMEGNIFLGACYYNYLTSIVEDDILEVIVRYNGGGRAGERFRRGRTINHESANHLIRFIKLKRLPQCRD